MNWTIELFFIELWVDLQTNYEEYYPYPDLETKFQNFSNPNKS
jgi:hypothetical protein